MLGAFGDASSDRGSTATVLDVGVRAAIYAHDLTSAAVDDCGPGRRSAADSWIQPPWPDGDSQTDARVPGARFGRSCRRSAGPRRLIGAR